MNTKSFAVMDDWQQSGKHLENRIMTKKYRNQRIRKNPKEREKTSEVTKVTKHDRDIKKRQETVDPDLSMQRYACGKSGLHPQGRTDRLS